METEELMKKIDEQYTKTPFYGSRRIAETFKAEGMCVNRKRIQRLMRHMDAYSGENGSLVRSKSA